MELSEWTLLGERARLGLKGVAMSRIAMPRWTVYAIVLTLVASMAFSIGAITSVGANAHDTSFHGCLYAGSLSQVGTTEPTNCGRGVHVSWPSTADFADLQAALEQEIEDRIAGDLDLQNQITALQSELGALENQVSALDGQVSDLEDQVGTLEDQVSTLESQVFQLIIDVAWMMPIVEDAEVLLALIQDVCDDPIIGLLCP